MNRVEKRQRVCVFLLLSMLSDAGKSAIAQPASINGAYDLAFGNALSIQTDATGFGPMLSELDGGYGLIAGGTLYLFISGNLQNNANNINIFIADGRAGQGTLAAVNPGNLGANNLSVMNGSKFSAGFSATYAFNINNNGAALSVSQYDLVHITSVDALGNLKTSGGIVANATVDNSVVVGFNNNNKASQATNIGPGSTGLELAIPLSLLGNPSGPVEVFAVINGSSEGYLSNQLLPGLPSGTPNLGGGGTGYGPGGGAFNLSSTTNFYFVVPWAPTLTVNGINADYGTTHVFLNEVSNNAVPLTVVFSPNASNVVEADVFSNLNRRDHSTEVGSNGIEEGIVPPNGNTIATGDTNHYYEAYPMSPTGTPGQYSLTLYAQKTGVYRLTARYQVAGSTNWSWYSTNAPYTTGNRRDFGIVVSPTKALEAVIYELAVNNIGAQGDATDGSQRGTFVDLYNGPGSRPYDPVYNRFNLNYVTNLGVNWLWLEPIHPIGIQGSINSPYCAKNYFAVSPWMSKANTRTAAMQEFQGFVAAADAVGVNVMLDEPFDHAAHDAELASEGVADFGGAGNPGNWQPTDLISKRVPQFFSQTNAWCGRASSSNDIAIAPDIDIPKWTDVSDVFYGDYAALVCENPQDDSNDLSAADWFDYTTDTGNFDYITQSVWRYFADSLLYWLDQTGCTNGTTANQTSVGIDGIRADFATGLPPQCWEYIINKVRSRKWDFVFLAESLGSGATPYRSSRDFDIVNDGVYNEFQTAATATNYQAIFNSERGNYGQCLMLWNATSHDVGFYYSDPYQALIRFMVGGTIDGTPHIFYGQEMGTTEGFGFSAYAGDVPDLFTFNSLQPAVAAGVSNFQVNQLYPLYAAVGQARQSSPALRSANRCFLNPAVSQPNIYAVAKFAATNGPPNFSDVVFAFVNLDTTNSHQATFSVNISQNSTNVFGIRPGRVYNVRNIAAYTGADPDRPDYWLWNGGSGGVPGSNILANGIDVSLNPVPSDSAGWTNAPFEAQYLKLYDVTPPPVPSAPGIGLPNDYVLSNSVTFSWPPVTDTQGGISRYYVTVGTTPGGTDVFSGFVTNTSLTVTNNFGARLYTSVQAVNNAGILSAASASSPGIALVDPNWIPVVSMTNSQKLSWSSVSGKAYQVWSTTNLLSPFTPLGGVMTAGAPVITFTNNATNAAQYFKIQLFP
jgi:glycosidase